MNPSFSPSLRLFAALALLIGASHAFADAPSIAMGPAGLVYTPDTLGNRIADFSYAGYKGGGIALPTLPIRATLSPIPGDNTANIQNAINTIAARTPDANGFRGALLLGVGTYQMNGSLTISASGVVLRGASQNATILQFIGANRTGVTLSGTSGSNGTGSATNITDTYVPLNGVTFNVTSTTGLSAGSTILVRRPWIQAWITAMQMDSTFLGTEAWTPRTGPAFERTITAINGTQITIDIPLPTPIEQQWGPGTVQRYTDTGRIQNSGVENLTLLDDFTANTGPLGLSLANCKNSWARNITVDSFGNGLSMDGGSKWCTIQDCIFQNGFNNGSARPSCFNIAGTLCLFQRCTAISGFEHIVTTQDSAAGPDVFLQINAVNSGSFDGGPHQKWALGVLMDNFTGPVSPLKIYNAGTEGTGHGWVCGYSIEYNCTTSTRTCQQPPVANHYNWIIGGSGTVNSVTNPGTFQNQNTIVAPKSLYVEQLRERLGSSALQNIGIPRFQGNYELLNVNSGLAAGVNGGLTVDGAPIVQTPFTATAANEWQFIDIGGGYFEIKNLGSNKALAAQTTASGALIIQSTYANSSTMQWSVKDLSGTTCEIINRASGLALEVPGSSTTAGTQLDQSTYTSTSNQQFRILPLQ